MSEFRRRLMMQSKEDNPILKDYLTIVALEDGLTAKLSLNACEYCVDGDGNWKTLPADTETESINNGQALSFRAKFNSAYTTEGNGTFTISKLFNLKGNSMSMIYGDEGKDKTSLGRVGVFRRLFRNSSVVDASKFILPSNTATDNCYYTMFANCEQLIKMPELPATTLGGSCYGYMFANCKSLVKTFDLPAKEATNNCYGGMFSGCSNLIEAPKIYATTVRDNSLAYMFQNCTSLIKAPELIATKLTNYCYQYIFGGCSKLNYIKMLATDVTTSSCLNNWVIGIPSTGIFVKAKDVEIPRGASGIPYGWTVIEE